MCLNVRGTPFLPGPHLTSTNLAVQKKGERDRNKKGGGPLNWEAAADWLDGVEGATFWGPRNILKCCFKFLWHFIEPRGYDLLCQQAFQILSD